MSTLPVVLDSAAAQAEVARFVRTKLAGKPTDVVGIVDDLLALVAAVGQLHCRLADDQALRFSLSAESSSFDVGLDRAHAKLRSICARLAYLIGQTDGQEFLPYGGEGRITRSLTPAANTQTSGQVERQFKVHHQNSNAAPIEFTITAL